MWEKQVKTGLRGSISIPGTSFRPRTAFWDGQKCVEDEPHSG